MSSAAATAVAERGRMTRRRRDNARCFSVCVVAMAGTVALANLCSLVSLSTVKCPTVDLGSSPAWTCVAQGYQPTAHCQAPFHPKTRDECGGASMQCLASSSDALDSCTCNRNDKLSNASWPAWQNSACLAGMSILVVVLGGVLVRCGMLPLLPQPAQSRAGVTVTAAAAAASTLDPVPVSEVLMAHAFIGLAFYFAAAQALNYAKLPATVWPIVAVTGNAEPGPTALAKGALIPVGGATSGIASVGCVVYGALVLAGHESRSRAAQTALAVVVFSSSAGSIYTESVETNVFSQQSANGADSSDEVDHMYAVGVTGVIFAVIGAVCSVSALFTLRDGTRATLPAQSFSLLWIGFAFNEGVSPGAKAFILTSMQISDTCHHFPCTATLILRGVAGLALAAISLSLSCLHDNEPVSKIDFRQAVIGGVPMAGGAVPLLYHQAGNGKDKESGNVAVAMNSPTVFRGSTHVTRVVYEGDEPMLVAGGPPDTATPGGSDMHW